MKATHRNPLLRNFVLVTTITAFAAGSAFAAQYKWVGTTDTDWTKASNYTTGTGVTAGPAPTGGTTTNRLSVNNHERQPATYNSPVSPQPTAQTPLQDHAVWSSVANAG